MVILWFTTSVVGHGVFFFFFEANFGGSTGQLCPFGLGFPRRFSYGSYGVCRLRASKDVTALVYDGSDKPSVGDSDGLFVARSSTSSVFFFRDFEEQTIHPTDDDIGIIRHCIC